MIHFYQKQSPRLDEQSSSSQCWLQWVTLRRRVAWGHDMTNCLVMSRHGGSDVTASTLRYRNFTTWSYFVLGSTKRAFVSPNKTRFCLFNHKWTCLTPNYICIWIFYCNLTIFASIMNVASRSFDPTIKSGEGYYSLDWIELGKPFFHIHWCTYFSK